MAAYTSSPNSCCRAIDIAAAISSFTFFPTFGAGASLRLLFHLPIHPKMKARISKASEEIKKNKKGLFLCDVIEARSAPMEKALEEITKEQEERKEKKDNEQHLGRSGRTGRENVPGRS